MPPQHEHNQRLGQFAKKCGGLVLTNEWEHVLTR